MAAGLCRNLLGKLTADSGPPDSLSGFQEAASQQVRGRKEGHKEEKRRRRGREREEGRKGRDGMEGVSGAGVTETCAGTDCFNDEYGGNIGRI